MEDGEQDKNRKDTPKDTSSAIGIDLGTTYSCVAAYQNGKIVVIPNSQGEYTTPSVVHIGDVSKKLRTVGTGAKSKIARDPKRVIFDTKRMIGRGYDDTVVQKAIKNWPFKVVKSDTSNSNTGKDNYNNIKIDVDGTLYTPVEISSYILTYLKQCAEKKLGIKDIESAVITVPAHFSSNQKQTTKDAASIAGFKNIRIVNEPTAAALDYGYGRVASHEGFEKANRVLVFDLGGGTFDVSVMDFESAEDESLGSAARVIGQEGDTFLGGVDIDNYLFTHVLDKFVKQNADELVEVIKDRIPTFNKEAKDLVIADLRLDDRAKSRLRAACESTKKNLSSSPYASVDIDAFYDRIDMTVEVSRLTLEEISKPLFNRCAEKLRGVLNSLGKIKSQYDSEGRLINGDNAEIEKQKHTIDRVVMVGGCSRIPFIREMIEKMFGQGKVKYNLDPDTAIARGAAYQAASIFGEVTMKQDLILLDATPLDISIETAGGVATIIIPNNTSIPIQKTMVFTTYHDNQPSVPVKIFEGLRPMAKDNLMLGEFELSGIPPAPKGVPQIEITILINSDGILTVTAVDKASGNSKAMTISNKSNNLTPEEIERMKKEAEKYKKDDDVRKEVIECKLELERMLSALKTCIEQAPAEAKANLQAKYDELSAWNNSNPEPSLDLIKAKVEELKQFISGLTGGAAAGVNGFGSNMPDQGSGNGPVVDEAE